MTDYSVFGATPGPSGNATDGQPLNLAHQVNVTSPCWALGLRYYRGDTAIAGTITGRLWLATGASTGTLVDDSLVTFADPGSGLGWQTALFAAPIPLLGGTYKPTVRFPDRWPNRPNFWEAGGAGENGLTSGPLTAPNAATALGGQGSFSAGAATVFPGTASSFASDYGVDLLVTDTDPEGGSGVADQQIAQDEIGIHNLALVANTEQVFRFADNVSTVEIVNMSGTAAVYYAVDSEDTAVAAGKKMRLIPATITSVKVPSPGQGPTVVRLVSPGTPTVSVSRG